MFWIMLNHPDTFSGPALNVLSFGEFLLPLAVLELYFALQRRGRAALSLGFAAVLFVLIAATGLGIFALLEMWLPQLR